MSCHPDISADQIPDTYIISRAHLFKYPCPPFPSLSARSSPPPITPCFVSLLAHSLSRVSHPSLLPNSTSSPSFQPSSLSLSLPVPYLLSAPPFLAPHWGRHRVCISPRGRRGSELRRGRWGADWRGVEGKSILAPWHVASALRRCCTRISNRFLPASPAPVSPVLSFISPSVHPLYPHPPLSYRSPSLSLCRARLLSPIIASRCDHPGEMRAENRTTLAHSRETWGSKRCKGSGSRGETDIASPLAAAPILLSVPPPHIPSSLSLSPHLSPTPVPLTCPPHPSPSPVLPRSPTVPSPRVSPVKYSSNLHRTTSGLNPESPEVWGDGFVCN